MNPTKNRSRSPATALIAALIALMVGGLSASTARATTTHGLSAREESAAATALLDQVAIEYRQAFPSHNPSGAAHARGLAAAAGASRLVRVLEATRLQLQVWPLPERVDTAARAAERAMVGGGQRAAAGGSAYDELDDLLSSADRATLAEAYAVFTQRLATRLEAVAPELVTKTDTDLWRGIESKSSRARVASLVRADLHDDAAALGQITVSRATIVSDAAIILFREGLEAVLILAAITASFTGARRHLRRPVLVGAVLGLGATAVTYVLAQVIVDALGDGGLRLQAITGLLAIAVLLIVTNWFFHRMYWSEWIARFNRRRKSLERVERLGIISGQTLGFLILGLTSVYREGFETVLFLQNLQVSAGTGATLLGVAIGLAATLVVGTITFALGRKLPYKRMLILTGILIGLVLAVMVGTTVNNLQGLGWIPASATGFTVAPRLSQWIGLYATWEGIGAQLVALLVVYGSYALARQLQNHRRRRAVGASGRLDQTAVDYPVGAGHVLEDGKRAAR